MKTTLLADLHQKALNIIEAIEKAETKRKGHVETAYSYKQQSDFVHYNAIAIEWQEKRAKANEAIAARLRVSYNRIIQKILLHKP